MRAVHPIPAPEIVIIPVPAKEVPMPAEKSPKPAKTGKKDAHLKVSAQARGAQRRNARQMPTRRMNNRGGR
jgi:hypothetical protein